MKKYVLPILFFIIGLIGAMSASYALNLEIQMSQQFENLPEEIFNIDTNACLEFPDLCSRSQFFHNIGYLIVFPVVIIFFFIHPSISFYFAPIIYAFFGMLITYLYNNRKNKKN